jgi:integrase/recombinase XerD
VADLVKNYIAAQAGKSFSSKKQARIVSTGFVSSSNKSEPKNWTKNDVFNYLSVLETNHSRNTLYNYTVHLRSFLRFYNREDLTDLLKLPRRPEILKVVPSDDEVIRMKAIAKNPRDKLIIQVLSRTGLRVGELCNLDIRDIDFENRQIHIRAKEDWHPKGLKERIVPFDSETDIQTRTYLDGRDSGLLFDLSESYVRRIVKELAEKAHVKDASKITPHSYRHYFAIYFLRHGGDIRSLQKILGHADLSTTAVYLTYTEDAVAQAYDRVFEKAEETEA